MNREVLWQRPGARGVWAGRFVLAILLALLLVVQTRQFQTTTSATFDETIYLHLGLEAYRSGSLEPLAAQGVAPIPILLSYWIPAVLADIEVAERTDFRRAIDLGRRAHALLIGVALVMCVFVVLARRRGSIAGALAVYGAMMMSNRLDLGIRYVLLRPTPTRALAELRLHICNFHFLLPLTIVATLNRETAVLIPLAFVIDFDGRRPIPCRDLGVALLLLAAWLGTFLTVRSMAGFAEPAITLQRIWEVNRSAEGLKSAATNIALFAGVAGWLLAMRGYFLAPRFVRRTVWLAVFYLPLYLNGASGTKCDC